MSIRTERVSSMLQREIADILSREYSDQLQSLVTVTGLKVTNDLSIANVYISVFGDDPEEKQAMLDHLIGLTIPIRTSLAARIRHQLKAVPTIRFYLDQTLTEAAHLDELFGRIRKDREEHDAGS